MESSFVHRADRHFPLRWLHDRLSLNNPPERVDLIFVFAGSMDRKRYGLELYNAGFAPRLLLSVGRFEVSKMSRIDFEGLNELIAQRDKLPPHQRHFFCEMDAAGLHIDRPKLLKWNTYGEILGLREYLQGRSIRSLMVISSDVHMRRVALMIDKVFHGAPLRFCYSSVPTVKDGYVLKETLKLAAYQVILRLPDWMIRRILRLKG